MDTIGGTCRLKLKHQYADVTDGTNDIRIPNQHLTNIKRN